MAKPVEPLKPVGRERVSGVQQRLARLRGPLPPRRHNARTIAALTGNPGCHRRAVLDGAGIDKQRVAAQVGFPARVGQSRFAIARGNAFEAQVKADGGAELLRLLRERLGLAVPEVDYTDLERPDEVAERTMTVPAADAGSTERAPDADAAAHAGPARTPEERYAHARELLTRAAGRPDAAGALFDHPLLRLDVAGQPVYLEPDLIALQVEGRFHVIEIKSFAVIDDQADPAKVSAAATQAAVYVLALRQLLAEAGHDPELVSHEVVLVCPRDFSNRPTAALLDVRKQLGTLRRQLSRMARIDELLARLPDGLTFDLAPDASGSPTRPAEELAAALRTIEARYSPECLAACEVAYFCRHESAGATTALGRSVREQLGGIDSVETVLGYAHGTLAPDDEQVEAAAMLAAAARLRTEALATVDGLR